MVIFHGSHQSGSWEGLGEQVGGSVGFGKCGGLGFLGGLTFLEDLDIVWEVSGIGSGFVWRRGNQEGVQ